MSSARILSGSVGAKLAPAFLLAGCLNVVAIAALGGLGGWLLRRRRPDLPKVVADGRIQMPPWIPK